MWIKRKQKIAYTLVISCESETAEKAAVTFINQNVQKHVVKKKTVLPDHVVLTSRLILNNKSTYFVNQLLMINGVKEATLLYDDA